MPLTNVIYPELRINPVNREKPVQEFADAINRIHTLGAIFQTLFEWYGSPGIGKSTLVYLLKAKCDELQTPYVAIDFSERNPQARTYAQDYSLLLEELTRHLFFKASDAGPILELIDGYRALPANAFEEQRQAQLNKAGRAFIRAMLALVEAQPVALFFDETERIDIGVVDWLEEWVINPLIQTGRCLVVWTGRRPQRWKRFEVRRRLNSQELDPFEPKDTIRLFRENSLGAIARLPDDEIVSLSGRVHRLTGGHPLADTVVLHQLGELTEQNIPLTERQFNTQADRLLDDLVQKFIDAYAFAGLQADLIDACRVMALVRQFDVIMLRGILKETLSIYAAFKPEEFGALLSRLRATQLVLWDDRRKGYTIDPTLRHILTEYIFHHHPKQYLTVNRLALAIYQDWIARSGDNRGVYIVEELYHQARINRLDRRTLPEGPVDLAALLQQRLDQYEQQDSDLRGSALDRLYHELEGDVDLRALVGDDAFARLLSKVDNARSTS